jgi:hypothetical protein
LFCHNLDANKPARSSFGKGTLHRLYGISGRLSATALNQKHKPNGKQSAGNDSDHQYVVHIDSFLSLVNTFLD